jgi:hypothetical protein
MGLRVVQWATGGVGVAAIKGWEALVGDGVVVRVTVNRFMGEENLDPA